MSWVRSGVIAYLIAFFVAQSALAAPSAREDEAVKDALMAENFTAAAAEKIIGMYRAYAWRLPDPEHVTEIVVWFNKQGVLNLHAMLVRYPSLLSYSVRNLEAKLDWLKAHGINTAYLMRLSAGVLSTNIEAGFEPKIAWFASLGISAREVFFKEPRIAFVKLENLKERAAWIREQKPVDLTRVLKQFPGILILSSQTIDQHVSWLRGHGVTSVVTVLTHYPRFFSFSIEALNAKVEWLQSWNITDVARIVTRAPDIFGLNIERGLDPRIRWLQWIGVADIPKLVTRYPKLLLLEIPNNTEKVEWLTKNGIKDVASLIGRFPAILSCNLFNDLQPKMRHYKKVWGVGVEELEEYPNLLGTSLSRVTELANALVMIGIDPKKISKHLKWKVLHKVAPADLLASLEMAGVLREPSPMSFHELNDEQFKAIRRVTDDGRMFQVLRIATLSSFESRVRCASLLGDSGK